MRIEDAREYCGWEPQPVKKPNLRCRYCELDTGSPDVKSCNTCQKKINVPRLPCPFCGCSKAEVYRRIYDSYKWDISYWVECWDCCVQTDHEDTIEQAVKIWNTRVKHEE